MPACPCLLMAGRDQTRMARGADSQGSIAVDMTWGVELSGTPCLTHHWPCASVIHDWHDRQSGLEATFAFTRIMSISRGRKRGTNVNRVDLHLLSNHSCLQKERMRSALGAEQLSTRSFPTRQGKCEVGRSCRLYASWSYFALSGNDRLATTRAPATATTSSNSEILF